MFIRAKYLLNIKGVRIFPGKVREVDKSVGKKLIAFHLAEKVKRHK